MKSTYTSKHDQVVPQIHQRQTVFIDGEYGTVGKSLQPHLQQLENEGKIDVIRVNSSDKRNLLSRQNAFAQADIAILCLPDTVARDAVVMAKSVNNKIRILDASAYHRTDPNWVYGLPELHSGFNVSDKIKRAELVANPGCFATACIMLSAPISALLPQTGNKMPKIAFTGITGKSASTGHFVSDSVTTAQLGYVHRHLAEINKYGNVDAALITSVGNWHQGMIVSATVDLDPVAVYHCYADAYKNHFITVEELNYINSSNSIRIAATDANSTDKIKISVVQQPNGSCAVIAVLDNLGKGSAGAAAANLRLMLDC